MKHTLFGIFPLWCILTVSATASAASANPTESVDPNYDVEQVIRKGRDQRREKAQKEFDSGPRESTLRITIAPSHLSGMHSDLSGGDGWGFATSMLVQANSDTPDFKFLIGGEILAFSAENDTGDSETKMNTLNLMLSLGCAYDFSQHFAMGAVLGYGLVGATHIEKDFADGDSETSATISTVLSIKPYAELMLNKNLSVYAAYRFVYVGSSIISNVADWGELETACHAVEVGIGYRF